MRILLSAFACEPNRGSEPGFGWNWALHLAQEGHDVVLMTTPYGRSAIDKQIELIGKSLSLNVKYVEVPTCARRFLKGHLGIVAHYYLWQKLAFFAAKNLVKNIDIIHHVTWGSIKGGSNLWRLQKPFVFGPIGGGQVAPNGYGAVLGIGFLLEQLRTLYTKIILPVNPFAKLLICNSALVLVTNKETFLLAKNLGGKYIKLFLDTGLSESFYPDCFPARHRRDVFKILWVGRLIPRKALPIAIEVLKKLKFPVKLIIVGDGLLRRKLKGWLKDPMLQKKIEWWGQVPWGKVREAYLTSDVFLFTSLRESFGSQIVEAMAFGLPIITLNVHGARDWVPENAGIKVDVGSLKATLEDLALSIERLYRSPEQCSVMGRVGYEYAKQQTWTRKASLIGKLYENVIRKQNKIAHSK
jgi:glycosyltransferase involved in cell wall biosynthesis